MTDLGQVDLEDTEVNKIDIFSALMELSFTGIIDRDIKQRNTSSSGKII